VIALNRDENCESLRTFAPSRRLPNRRCDVMSSSRGGSRWICDVILTATTMLLMKHSSTTTAAAAAAAAAAGGPASRSSSLPVTQMSPRTVQTQYGKLRGIIVLRPTAAPPSNAAVGLPPMTNAGSSRLRMVPVEQFLGLQYASTLGSELRFMPPTGSMEKWEGVHVALKHRAVCPQPIPDVGRLSRRMPRGRVEHFRRMVSFVDKQTEDCLSLNVYVPLPGEYYYFELSSVV
jgi:hypothetical protein